MSTGWSSEWLDFAYMDLSAAEHLLEIAPAGGVFDAALKGADHYADRK